MKNIIKHIPNLKNKKITVLSLFDGISCARIALDKAGIKIDKYYASEIDKYALKVSNKHYPDIIQLGDIRKISAKKLGKIDLLIGGSPCQDLSNAKTGEGLKGEKSRLFYEYVRLLKEIKPTYFLLENVKNKWGDKMSEIIGIDFVHVNSAIFSAQSRPRYYWTNIKYPDLPLKESDKTIKSIIHNEEVDDSFYFNNKGLDVFLKKYKNNTKTLKQTGIIKLFDIPKSIINDNERQRRIYSIEGKSPTILARSDTTKIFINGQVRKLTPTECECLQTIPKNYTANYSNTQRYKMIGNAFTVDSIAHFLKGII
jgi:DNA-cytosine methyltransferase